MNRLVFSYEIKVGEEVYVKAKTVQVAIDKNSGEMHFFLPEKLRNMISESLDVSEEL
jgi:acyl-CoA thioesterase FadM